MCMAGMPQVAARTCRSRLPPLAFLGAGMHVASKRAKPWNYCSQAMASVMCAEGCLR